MRTFGNPGQKSRKWLRFLLKSTKLFLFLIGVYCTTSYSRNLKQIGYKHAYSSLRFLYFTNQSLYLSLITVTAGFLSRHFPRLIKVYTTLLPVSLSFDTVVVLVFWPLFFIKKELVVNRRFIMPGYETPVLTELGLHLFPLFLVLLDQVNIKLERHKDQVRFMFAYLILWSSIIMCLGIYKGRYIYPFMNAIKSHTLVAIGFVPAMAVFYWVYSVYMKVKCKRTESL